MPRRRDAKPFNLTEIFGATAAERSSRRHSGNYPAIRRAANRVRNAVGTALLRNQIERPLDCSRCLRPAPGRIAAIHADYTKPLEITWVCLSCSRYDWQDRQDRCAVAMANGGGYVNGVWIAPVGVRPPDSPVKTLAAYSRRPGAHGGDAVTRRAVEAAKRTASSNAVVEAFIAADIERYLCGKPSIIGDVLAGKGAEVIVK